MRSSLALLAGRLLRPRRASESLRLPPADLALLPPPAVWSRVLIWTLGAGSIGLLLWSVLTKVDETVLLSGEVVTERSGVQVAAQDPGIVSAVYVMPHQSVSLGQVLLTYSDDETDGRLTSQLRRHTLLRRQQAKEQTIFLLRRRQIQEQIVLDSDLLKRLVRLSSVGAIQETQVLEKRAQVSKSQLSMSSLAEEMSRSSAQFEQQIEDVNQSIRELKSKKIRFVVKAPVAGFVQEIRYQSSGERIQPTDLVAVIIPDQSLIARIRVPSRLRAPLKIGTQAVVDVDAFPASEHGSIRAEVASVSPTTSEGTPQSPEKTYDALLKFISVDSTRRLKLSELRPGMALTAKIRLRDKPVIATVFDILGDLFDPLNQER